MITISMLCADASNAKFPETVTHAGEIAFVAHQGEMFNVKKAFKNVSGSPEQ